MRKAFKDAEFHREYKKLIGQDSDPTHARIDGEGDRDPPRDAEVIELLKNFRGKARFLDCN